MEAENSSGVYERAVRLAALAAESVEGDAVRDALVHELRVLLDLESVTVVTSDQDPAARHAGALPERAEFDR